MKTIATILAIILLGSYAFPEERAADVSLRYSRHAGIIRVVLESGDSMIRNSRVHATPAGIRVDFPFSFQIRKPADFIFETSVSGQSFTVMLKDVKDIKTSMLSAPARIVFDMTTAAPASRKPTAAAAPAAGPASRADMPYLPAAPGTRQTARQSPKPEEAMPGIRVVVLDAGHGGYEYGIVDGSAREKDVNLAITRELGAALSGKGKMVFSTRKADQSVSIAERIDFANAKNPDLFISVHAGLSNNYVIYISSPEDQNADATVRLYALSYRQGRYIDKSRAAAAAIGLSITNDSGSRVTLRELPLPVLNSLSAPAILIEYPSLKSYASNQKMREQLVSSIMEGITAYER